MADTGTGNLSEEHSLDSQKARRHSDIRVFSGSATPNIAEVAPEEVNSRTSGAVRSFGLRSDLSNDLPCRMPQYAGYAWTVRRPKAPWCALATARATRTEAVWRGGSFSRQVPGKPERNTYSFA